MSISKQSIELVRQFIRAQSFTPLSNEEVCKLRYRMLDQNYNSAIEGNPMDDEDLAFWHMLWEERAPTEIRELALDYLFNEVEAAQNAA